MRTRSCLECGAPTASAAAALCRDCFLDDGADPVLDALRASPDGEIVGPSFPIAGDGFGSPRPRPRSSARRPVAVPEPVSEAARKRDEAVYAFVDLTPRVLHWVGVAYRLRAWLLWLPVLAVVVGVALG